MNREILANKIIAEAQRLIDIAEQYEHFYVFREVKYTKIYRACNLLVYKLYDYFHFQTVNEQFLIKLTQDHISEESIDKALEVIPSLSIVHVSRDRILLKEGIKSMIKDLEVFIAMSFPQITDSSQIQESIDSSPKELLVRKIETNLTNMLNIATQYYDIYEKLNYRKVCKSWVELWRILLIYHDFLLRTDITLTDLMMQNPIEYNLINKSFIKSPNLKNEDIIRDRTIFEKDLITLRYDSEILVSL